MQAEHSRGNGFIISPLSPVSEVSFFSTVKTDEKKPEKKFFAKKLFKDISISFCSSLSYHHKKVLIKALSASVAICSILGCTHFYTVGTAIICDGRAIAYSSDEKGYFSALASAKSYAEDKGVSRIRYDFETVPAFILRNKLSTGKNLRDKLLLNLPGFSQACTLYSGSTAVFNAENEKTAKEVVSEYITSFSMNGKADAASKLTYKKNILPVGQISDKEECLLLLSQSGDVPVISVVSSSVQKEIPFKTETLNDASLYIGESVIVSEGKSGSAEVKSETVYKNGLQESSRILSENVVANPVTRVVRVGTKPKDVLNSGLYYPLHGTISSNFGKRWGRNHEGTDFAVPVGTPVKAAECGTVIFAGDGGSYGKLIKIDHGNGVVTAYAHLSEITVTDGQAVSAGYEIALSGNTGRSTGPHLHFEVVKDGTPLDPCLYLNKE